MPDSRPISKQLPRIAALALLYLALGRLALALALPPGYASPVWPAAGVALGALLVWGRNVWPGVFLGSVLVNLAQTIGVSQNPGMEMLLLFGVAAGASLQAVAGEVLIRRITGFPIPAHRTLQILAALALAGPLSCLISASLGVSLLFTASLVPYESIAANWFAWWQGDSLGVIAVLPLVSIWRIQMHHASTANRIKALLPMAIALIFSLAIFLQSRQSAQNNTRLTFELLCNETVSRLSANLSDYLDDLYALRNFYRASREVEAEEFAVFAAPLIARHPATQTLEWAPRVPLGNREEVEKMLPAGIRERAPDGMLRRAAPRDAFYPVLYVEPRLGNEMALGFDLGSDPQRKEALEQAVDSSEASASQAIHLVQDQKRTPAVIALLPVYGLGNIPPSVEQRRLSLEGFVAAVLRIPDIINQALDTATLTSLSLRILERTNGQTTTLYGRQTDPAETPAGLHSLKTLTFAGRTWTLEFTPTAAFWAEQNNWQARVVLTSGLLFSCLLGVFSFLVTGHAEDIRCQVRMRTSELADANEQLRKESTALKELSGALEESELRHRAIVEKAVDAIITINEQGLIQSFNPAAEKLFGYSLREVVGKNISLLQPEPHCSHHDEYLRRYLETGEAHIIGIEREVSGKRRDGSKFPLDLSVSEIRLDGRRLFMGILRDITVRKQAEETLQRANERLVEVDRLKSLFVASMSHELRTPLNSIIGFSSILLNEWAGPINQEQRENLDTIARTGKHLLALINDVIDVSKIEAGRLDVHRDRFDLHDLIDEVVQIELSHAQSQGLELVVENLHHSLVTDRLRLLQCVMNLLSNAIKYTPAGQITLSAILKDKERLEIWVRDTGIGIAEEDRVKIFQPFIRLESALKSNRKGTGLGLFLTHKLATEVLAGTLSFQSTPGEGSLFVLSIPSATEQT